MSMMDIFVKIINSFLLLTTFTKSSNNWWQTYQFFTIFKFVESVNCVIEVSFTEISNENVPNTGFDWKASAVTCNNLYEKWYMKK